MFRPRSDPFDDVPQHCRPDRPPMFAASRAPFWESPGDSSGPDRPPATEARAELLTESAPGASCFGPATPPKAAAPTRPAVLPAPRAAVAAAPLVQAAPRQAHSPPQPASACSPGPQQPTDPSQQPTDQSRRRKMLRPRCASGPAPLAAPAAHAWDVETEVADDAFLLALQAAEQKAGGGAEGGGTGGGPLHREARPRSAAAAEGGG
eukprot:scaffold7251_cov54-Phaeocystis_antarctica.AAC.1